MAITTAEQLLKAGNLGRCELVRGRLRRMIPAGDMHGRITATLAYLVERHVRERNLGVVHGAETGFILARDPDTVRAPDLAFTRADRALPPTGGFVPRAPDLAVEVLSPDDRPRAVREKVAAWLGAGAEAVWIVDPRARTVTVHAERGIRVFGGDDALPDDVLPGLAVAVSELFPETA